MNDENKSCAPTFTAVQHELYTRRYEEGYDLVDEQYSLWLQKFHPEEATCSTSVIPAISVSPISLDPHTVSPLTTTPPPLQVMSSPLSQLTPAFTSVSVSPIVSSPSPLLASSDTRTPLAPVQVTPSRSLNPSHPVSHIEFSPNPISPSPLTRSSAAARTSSPSAQDK